MKKIFLGLIVLSCLLFTGCGAKEKTMRCFRTATFADYSMDLEYVVTYIGNDVQTVKSVEEVSSDNSPFLEAFKTQIEKMYLPYDGIKYYDHSIATESDKVISTVTVDYSKVDTDKMIEIDSSNGSLIKNGKINIDDMKSAYEATGATCEK